MSREIGDRRSMARALYNAGAAFNQLGELARSRAPATKRSRFGATSPIPRASRALHGLGELAALQGDLPPPNGCSRKRSSWIANSLALGRLRIRSTSSEKLRCSRVTWRRRIAGIRRHSIRAQMGEQGTAAESRAALAVLALEEGKAAEAESLARAAATVFAAQKAPGNEATARATLARALLAQGKREVAAREIDARRRWSSRNRCSSGCRCDRAARVSGATLPRPR